jgi:sulfotransferase
MIHFISGLPRSGSTLLAAILCQNPRFSASFQTPLAQVVTTAIEALGPTFNEGALLTTKEQRERMLRGLFYGFYYDKINELTSLDGVVFDNNRRWTANMALLHAIFPGSRIIITVRDPRLILDSFERIFQRNPTQVSRIIGVGNTNVYQRVQTVMDPANVLGHSFNCLREAYYGAYAPNLLLVDFESLVSRPLEVLGWLHEQLGEEDFTYDINNVAPLPGAEEFDRNVGLPGLHSTRRQVSYVPQPYTLPPDAVANIPPFWTVDGQKNPSVKAFC